ncbi:hypothetical protein HRH25_23080 [Flavisolibacter sp. BT320]|nr:hypothetical protein [Flavisolibacter longurius]
MKKVSLKFETILRLYEFLDVAAITSYSIDRISNIIRTELSLADIELAERSFHAKVIRLHCV